MTDCIIPQGYKATPLGIIPQEWEVRRLGDLCCNQGDYGINAPAVAYSNDLPTYLRITDISDDGKFIIDNKASVNSPNSKNYHLEEGDIVFARTGATVGKTYLYDPADGDLVFAGFLIRFSPNERKIIPYYLKTYTDTAAYWYWVKIISQRSGQPGINAAEYSSLQLPVPPLAEQRKIAEVLGLWDKAIEKQLQLIEQLTLRKRGLMQQLLTAKRRLPSFSSLCQKIRLEERCEKTGNDDDKKEKIGQGALISQGYKPTSFGFIPQEWVVMPLSRAFRIQSGYAFKSELFTKNCGTPVVRISNLPMNDKYIDLSDCVYYPVSIDVKEQFIIHKNDFLIAMSGATTGKSAIYNYDYEALLNQRVGVFRQISDKIDSQYLHIIMESQWFIFQLQYLLIAGAQPNISPSDVENMVFPIPSLPEQKAIAQVLTAADREIELAQQKLELLRQQKRGLMQQLLTGKKRIKY